MDINLKKLLADEKLKKAKDHWSERRAITVWISSEQKEAYDRLQAQSCSRFGKILQIIVRDVIDEASSPNSGQA